MRLLQPVDFSTLENKVFVKGEFIPPSAETLKQFTNEQIALLCHKHGMYNFPTTEQLEWLRANLDLENTIEIGAGNGHLAKLLGIKATDSMQQKEPEIAAYYKMIGQPIIPYGANVGHISALAAIEKYKPKHVLGCWVTQLWKSDEDIDANYAGIDEEHLLEMVQKYVVIGATHIHGRKRILSKPHTEYKFDWLYSRTPEKENNRIYEWDFTKKLWS